MYVPLEIFCILFTACHDSIPNCSAYTTAVCTNSQYNDWVSKNCPAFCNKCCKYEEFVSLKYVYNRMKTLRPFGDIAHTIVACILTKKNASRQLWKNFSRYANILWSTLERFGLGCYCSIRCLHNNLTLFSRNTKCSLYVICMFKIDITDCSFFECVRLYLFTSIQ